MPSRDLNSIQQIVKQMMERSERPLPTRAEVYAVDPPRIDIMIPGSSAVIRHVEVVGEIEKLRVGDSVALRWEHGRPQAMLVIPGGSEPEDFRDAIPVDGETVEYGPDGLRVKLGSIGISHVNWDPFKTPQGIISSLVPGTSNPSVKNSKIILAEQGGDEREYTFSSDGLIAALTAASSGDTVILPPGRIEMLDPITISVQVTLKGAGKTATEIYSVINVENFITLADEAMLTDVRVSWYPAGPYSTAQRAVYGGSSSVNPFVYGVQIIMQVNDSTATGDVFGLHLSGTGYNKGEFACQDVDVWVSVLPNWSGYSRDTWGILLSADNVLDRGQVTVGQRLHAFLENESAGDNIGIEAVGGTEMSLIGCTAGIFQRRSSQTGYAIRLNGGSVSGHALGGMINDHGGAGIYASGGAKIFSSIGRDNGALGAGIRVDGSTVIGCWGHGDHGTTGRGLYVGAGTSRAIGSQFAGDAANSDVYLAGASSTLNVTACVFSDFTLNGGTINYDNQAGVWLDLTDTPGSFSGQAGKVPTVDSDEAALEFTAAAGVSNFLALDDTPSSFSGQAGKTVEVDSDEAALIFVPVSGDSDHGALFGLADDDHTQYSLVTGTRAFSGTVAGVLPTADAHLATKAYVDSEVLHSHADSDIDHGALIGLGDDDHTQYHTDGRALTWLGTRSIADLGTIDHDLLDGLADDDHTQYSLVTGARDFTGNVNIVKAAGETTLGIDGTDSENVGIKLRKDGTLRWYMRNNTTEDFQITRYDSDGVFVDSPFTILEASGGVILTAHLEIATYEQFTAIATPTAPAAGFARFYMDSDGHPIFFNDSDTWDLSDIGSGDSDHGALGGLADDDHTQYAILTGVRPFTATQAGVDPVADSDFVTKGWHEANDVDTTYNDSDFDHGGLDGLADDDHVGYARLTGVRPFTAAQAGVDPSLDSDLATKGYVDGLIPAAGQWTDAGGWLYPTESSDDVLIGGDSDSTATIHLRADGTADFDGNVLALGYLRTDDLLWASGGVAGTKIVARYENFDDTLGVSAAAIEVKLSGTAWQGIKWEKEVSWQAASVASIKDVHVIFSTLSNDSELEVMRLLSSGSAVFAGLVSGITPVSDSDLATKAYVDSEVAGATIADSDIDHGLIDGLGDDDHTIYSLATGTRSFTGNVTLLSSSGPINLFIDGPDSDLGGLLFRTTGTTRWHFFNSETQDLIFARYDSDGVFADIPLRILEDTGNISIAKPALFASYLQTAQIADPGTPAAGFGWFYQDSDGHPIFINDSDTWDLSALGSGGDSDHGALGGLADDDHTQYAILTGARPFTAAQAGVDPVADSDFVTKGWHVANDVDTTYNDSDFDHGGLDGLADDDHTQYALLTGARPFTGTVAGITPVVDSDLATKGYIDALVTQKNYTLTDSDGWYRIAVSSGQGAGGQLRIWGLTGSNKNTDMTVLATGMGFGQGAGLNIIENLFYNGNHIANIRSGTDSDTKWVIDIEIVDADTDNTQVGNLDLEVQGRITILDVPIYNPIAPTGSLTLPGNVLGGGYSGDLGATNRPHVLNPTGQGKVGIGTTNPFSALHVKDSDADVAVFTGAFVTFYTTVSGMDPVADSDFVTKSWHVTNDVDTTYNDSDFDHGGLDGLADDDHTQYALLAGRAGGQILIGGPDSDDDLELRGPRNVILNPDVFLHIGHGPTNEKQVIFWQGAGGTSGFSVTMRADFDNFYLTNPNGPVVIEQADSHARGLALQEPSSPFNQARMWFAGTSAGGTGMWFESGGLAGDINLKLQPTDSDTTVGYVNIRNDSDDIVARISNAGAVEIAQYLELTGISAPAAGPSGSGRFYTDSDGHPIFINDSDTWDLSSTSTLWTKSGEIVFLAGVEDVFLGYQPIPTYALATDSDAGIVRLAQSTSAASFYLSVNTFWDSSNFVIDDSDQPWTNYQQSEGAHIFYGSPVEAGPTATLNNFLTMNTTEAVFNEGGLDIDFRIEADSDVGPNAFFLRASDGRIGFGTGTPGHDFEISRSADAKFALISLDDGDSDFEARAEMIIRGQDSNGRATLSIEGAHAGFDGSQIADGPSKFTMTADMLAPDPVRFSWSTAANTPLLKLDVENDGSGGSKLGALTVMGNGRIGIGTTNPNVTSRLHVFDPLDSDPLVVIFENTGPSYSQLSIYAHSDTAGDQAIIQTIRSRGIVTAQTAVQNNDSIGAWQAWGFDSDSNEFVGGIHWQATENFTETGHGVRIVFNAVPNASVSALEWLQHGSGATIFNNGGEDIDVHFVSDDGTPIVFIDAASDSGAGRVGINTSTPVSTFDVVSGGSTTVARFMELSSPITQIVMINDDDTSFWGMTADNVFFGGYSGDDSDNLNIGRISGDVGIGTTSIARKLHVAGAQRLEEYLEFAGIADPGTPGTGFGWLYVDTDSHLIFENPSDKFDLSDPKVTIFTVEGTIATSTGKLRMYNKWGRTIEIVNVFIAVNTAPTGTSLIVDIHKGGTTIFTTQSGRPEIAISGFTDTSSTPDVTSWAADEYLTMDVDQIGSTIAGADLVVHVVGN